MHDRRSEAPIQVDPIRARLGKTGRVREVSCPNCGVIHATTHRWQMRCPECRHTWTDRSSRTWLDEVRDRRTQFFGVLVIVGVIIVTIASFGVFVAGLFAEAAEVRGWERTYGLAAFFVTCVVSILVLGRLRH